MKITKSLKLICKEIKECFYNKDNTITIFCQYKDFELVKIKAINYCKDFGIEKIKLYSV
jgi:hypothetical protein